LNLANKLLITLFILLPYILSNLIRPRGLIIYILPIVSWFLIFLTVLKLYGLGRVRVLSIYKTTVVTGLVIAVLQLVLLIDAGFITGFGRSPYSHTPRGILINLAYISSMLLGMEFSRAYLLDRVRRQIRALVLTSLLYTLVLTPLIKLLSLPRVKPLEIVDFLGSQLLVTLIWNLLASELVLLAGPLASLAYRVPIEVFWRFSPVLPDLTWGWKIITGVVPPIVGFTAVIYQATPSQFRKLGIRPEREGGIRALKRERKEILWTTIFCIVAILAIWFATGLLGVFPSIAISGSMRPTIDVGDLLIMVKVPAEKIAPGDIIQYVTERGMVVHRVIAIERGYFVTKGDANEAPDPDPVHPLNVRGKLIAIIPKVGWASIYLKQGFKILWTILTGDPIITCIALASITILTLIALKKRRWRRWRHKRW